MIAGVLAKLGFDMGQEGEQGFTDWLHPKGMWESSEFKRLNKAILASCGMTRNYRYVNMFPTEEAINKAAIHFSDMMESYCDSRPPMWGIKTPRLILTAHIWHPLVPDPHYIYWTRTGRSVTQNVAEDIIESWKHRIQKFIADKKAECFNYEDMLEHPVEEIIRVATFLGVPVTKEAVEIVIPELNNSRSGDEQRRIQSS